MTDDQLEAIRQADELLNGVCLPTYSKLALASEAMRLVGEVASRGRFVTNVDWYAGVMPPVGTKLYTD